MRNSNFKRMMQNLIQWALTVLLKWKNLQTLVLYYTTLCKVFYTTLIDRTKNKPDEIYINSVHNNIKKIGENISKRIEQSLIS